MTLMIQFLLYRQNSNVSQQGKQFSPRTIKGNAILMGKLARLKSRVVYNLRQNVFCIGRPQCQFDETNDWFVFDKKRIKMGRNVYAGSWSSGCRSRIILAWKRSLECAC